MSAQSSRGRCKASAFGLSAGGATDVAYQSIGDLFGSGALIGTAGYPYEDPAPPKAFLNYILFDDNYVPYDFGYDQIDSDGEIPGSGSDRMSLVAKVTKPGYLYVYLSNENPVTQEVYFDDLKIRHVKGVAIQGNDYYPFGLTFNSYQREISLPQNYQYNSKELQDELNLGWFDYGARMYQPGLARWLVKDPLGELYEGFSPYNYALNNPIRFIDPNGMGVVENDTSIVFTGGDAVEYLNFLKTRLNEHSRDDEPDEALIGAPALRIATETAAKKGLKFGIGGTAAYFLSFLMLQGDTGPDLYTPEQAERRMQKYISEGNLVAAKEYANEYNKRNKDKIVFRYLSAKEGMFLGKTMVIENCDQNLKQVRKYITPDFYVSSQEAKSLLALPCAPNMAVWTFQSQIQPTKVPQVGWNIVPQDYGEPGGVIRQQYLNHFPCKERFFLANKNRNKMHYSSLSESEFQYYKDRLKNIEAKIEEFCLSGGFYISRDRYYEETLAINLHPTEAQYFSGNICLQNIDSDGPLKFRLGIIKTRDIGKYRYWKKKIIVDDYTIDDFEKNVVELLQSAFSQYDSIKLDELTSRIELPQRYDT